MTLALSRSASGAENPAEVMEMGRIDVIATTPLPGLGTPIENVPANVQVFSARDLARRRASAVPDLLERGAASVTLNSGQGNAFQPDLNYRGFTASPLLGLPQGLSVFQDGVRVNEPFGDVVNWDLIPQSAIASIQLIPGSNPAFGPNTLGGVLAIYTKSGNQFPGGALEMQGGSFARRALQVEQGGSAGAWDWFATANVLDEHGWAEHNPSRLRQLFAKVGYQTERTDVDVSVTLADNALSGTQTLPVSFLDDIRQPYTYPDRNTNRLEFLAAKGSRFVSDALLLGATVYVRKFRNENFSSNVNAAFGAPGEPEATNDIALVDESAVGLGLQATLPGKIASRDNRFVAGASFDRGEARFTRRSQDATFTPSRGTIGMGEFARDTDAFTRNSNFGVVLSDAFAATEHWVFSVSARHHVTRVRIEDRSGEDPLLDGSHRFSRTSAAFGATFNPSPRLTAYAGYSESMRAPTPMELTCADPGAPCKLPNGFLSDPALRAVISKTAEAGARGKWSDAGSWSAALYRTELYDDIQFVRSAAATNAGFFQNVGRTRREGVELGIASRHGAIEIAARYSLTRATFQSDFLEASPNNSSADENGAIRVRRGDRIPSIPLHALRLRVAYEPGERASIAASVVANSRVYARGDENNQDSRGTVPGYAVVSLDARWQVVSCVELFARIDNVADKRYANFGILGENLFPGPERTFAPARGLIEQFRGPGAPRGLWVGLRTTWP